MIILSTPKIKLITNITHPNLSFSELYISELDENFDT